MYKRDEFFDEAEALHSAVRVGDVTMAEELLKRDILANVTNNLGETPLHTACRINEFYKVDPLNRLSILKLLWENGSRINAKGGLLNETALHIAIKSQQVDVINFLLQNGANPNSYDKNGRTPLHLVAAIVNSTTNKVIFELLLHCSLNLHAQDADCKTPLIEAVCNRNEDIVCLLLKAGAQINYKNRMNLTALFYACIIRSVEMVSLLLCHGAAVNIRGGQKRSSPLHFVVAAFRNSNLDNNDDSGATIARLLVNSGAYVDTVDEEGYTALHVAVDVKDESLVETLLDVGARVDLKDEYGNTPLHVLLMTAGKDDEMKIERIARLIVEKGARVNEQNANLETPFHYAVWRGNANLVSYLLENDADTSILWYVEKGSLSFLHESPIINSEEAFIPFNVAVTLGHFQVVKFLLEFNNGADIETSNFTGSHEIAKTPLYFAVKNDRYDIAKLLLDAGCKVNRLVLHETTVLHMTLYKKNTNLAYLLLEYGADINIKDVHGKTAFSSAVGNGAYAEEVLKIFVMHYVKRSFQNLYINDEDFQIIRSEEWLLDFKLNCERELLQMKSEIICDNLTMYALFTKKVDNLAVCLGNKNVVSYFNSVNIQDKYPIYCDMLRIHFDLALERREFCNFAAVSLNVLFKSEIEKLGYKTVPDEIIQKIFSYCNLRDLLKMKLAANE